VPPTQFPVELGCETICIGVATANVADCDVAVPQPFCTTQSYVPASPTVTVRVRVAALLSGITTPLRCHMYVKGGVPLVATEKVASDPLHTVVDAGCEVMAGLLKPLRASVTADVVALPQTLVATQS